MRDLQKKSELLLVEKDDALHQLALLKQRFKTVIILYI